VLRATRGLDLVPDPAPANLDELARTLSALGGRHPIAGTLTATLLARPVSMKIETRAGDGGTRPY